MHSHTNVINLNVVAITLDVNTQRREHTQYIQAIFALPRQIGNHRVCKYDVNYLLDS